MVVQSTEYKHKRLSVWGMDKMGPSGETGGRNNVH